MLQLNRVLFIKFLQEEENSFHHMRIQFAILGARAKQVKTIAIQRRIYPLGERYYDGLMSVMEYFDGLSFPVNRKK
jgi:hypothetical protein